MNRWQAARSGGKVGASGFKRLPVEATKVSFKSGIGPGAKSRVAKCNFFTQSKALESNLTQTFQYFSQIYRCKRFQAAVSRSHKSLFQRFQKGIGAGAKSSWVPLCSNPRFLATKSSGFLPHPGFVEDQSRAKNMCPTATETREDGKTDPEWIFFWLGSFQTKSSLWYQRHFL